MLSKNQIKLITSLKQKKFRQQHGFFVAEGIKTINELLQSSLKLHELFTTKPFNNNATKATMVSEKELKRISFLKTPNTALAVFEIPQPKPIKSDGLIVALDAVSDPGNLGTIIRLCDWFGITQLICNSQTVDCYNPKVVQSSMGSLTRVQIRYTDLTSYLAQCELPVYATAMNGNSVYKTKTEQNAILVMGNEANGISDEVMALCTEKIAIPRFGKLQQTESLNVAMATSILLSEFKRNS